MFHFLKSYMKTHSAMKQKNFKAVNVNVAKQVEEHK